MQMTRLIATSLAVEFALGCSATPMHVAPDAQSQPAPAEPIGAASPPSVVKRESNSTVPMVTRGSEDLAQPKLVAPSNVIDQTDSAIVPTPERCAKRPYTGPLPSAARITLSANNEIVATFARDGHAPFYNARIVLDNGSGYAWYFDVVYSEEYSLDKPFATFVSGAYRYSVNASQRQYLAGLVNQKPFFAYGNAIGPCVYDAQGSYVFAANAQQAHRVLIFGTVVSSPLRGLDQTMKQLLGSAHEPEHKPVLAKLEGQEITTAAMINDLNTYMSSRPACDPKRVIVQAWLDRVIERSEPSHPHFEEDNNDTVCYPKKSAR